MFRVFTIIYLKKSAFLRYIMSIYDYILLVHITLFPLMKVLYCYYYYYYYYYYLLLLLLLLAPKAVNDFCIFVQAVLLLVSNILCIIYFLKCTVFFF